jgi:16S rRNA processing protein RimM
VTLLEVGRIARAHGLRGELVVELITDRHERVAPGSRLFTDRGEFVVLASRPHLGRYIVAVDGCVDRTSAEAMAGLTLRAEPLEDPDALWAHDVIGTTVVERDGTARGNVVSVQANPAHDLLVLDSGALVPIVFVVSSEGGITTIDAPAGLFELGS